MQLPHSLRQAIDGRLLGVSVRHLRRSAELMAEAEHDRLGTRLGLAGPDRVDAYLASRFPAVFCAVLTVLREVPQPTSLLDLGAGPGTAALAALECWEGIDSFTLIEPDKHFVQAGRELLGEGEWLNRDFGSTDVLPERDMVVAAYSIGELESPLDAVDRAWTAAQSTFVMIEPGTPQSFALIRKVRDHLIARGAHMVVPCPGTGPCPMPEGDTCHFNARVERSALHRQLKGGSLPYEDEKFSFVAFSKRPVETVPGRIVRHPQIQAGFIKLQVCVGERIAEVKVTHRNKEKWREARRSGWGDAFSVDSSAPGRPGSE